jgi:protein involved in polysaccharide export with SLBB domain
VLRAVRFIGSGSICVLAVGCTITPDSGLVFFPQPYRLNPAADQLRTVQQHPLDLPRETAKQPFAEYRMEPGDVLQITPVKSDTLLEFPTSQTVQPNGTIDLATYGRIKVVGLTVDEIETAASNAIKAKTGKPDRVEVFQVKWTSKVFYIDGEVRSPGMYTLEGRETVLDGIFAAGGLNRRASHGNIILSRPTTPCGGRIVLPVCYDDIFQVGDSTTNYQLQPGDRIFVPTTTFADRFHKQKKPLPCNGPQTPTILPSTPCDPKGCSATAR